MDTFDQFDAVDTIELPEDEAAAFEAKIAEADRELEARVNFRWNREALDTIKRAARLAGVPYQTWLKQVAFEKALDELERAQKLGLIAVPQRPRKKTKLRA